MDASQAFGRVWLAGLMYKIKLKLPKYTHKLLESYIYERKFAVRSNTAIYNDHPIGVRVPQGSVLGPTLYLLYKADLPTSRGLTTSTFADDTAILSGCRCPIQASAKLALHLVDVEKWLSDWRIKVNEQKSKQVTFTVKKQDWPSLSLNKTVILKAQEVVYQGVHLDKRLTWRKPT